MLCHNPAYQAEFSLRLSPNLTGLSKLTSLGIEAEITVEGNSSLTSLTGVHNITSSEVDLYVASNPLLTDLTGIPDAIDVWSDVEIWSNNLFNSITGLGGATLIGNLTNWGNSNLSTCEIASVCDYLDSSNGRIEISVNAPGCDSQSEVEEACLAVGVSDVNIDFEYLMYPNPVTDSITILPPEGIAKPVHFQLYD